ncbi:hypothetical protein TAMA11512_09080 [Selenomonas sp. TAMA-11512]|uniref:hypothetical protein n=1 Tax=Selenomonas sp. TAMA-11512 TaxID=3095337 RepID=UPI00308D2544|nr:hypothetical protein TAMA11512_09080 [Selenomonas sp. TAMA-11512]
MKWVLIVLGCVVGIPVLLILGYFACFSLAILAPAINGALIIICVAVLIWAAGALLVGKLKE